MSELALRIRGLFGDDYLPKSERGYWLARCRETRAQRSWIGRRSYAWWRYTDDLKAQQRKLLSMRRAPVTD